MANDLFGGLMKGLSGFMPQDDPDVKLMSAQSDLSDLQQQETAIYADIGRQSLAQFKGRFPELESRLQLVQTNIAESQAQLEAVQAEKKQKEQAEQRTEQQCVCPQCGYRNLEGRKVLSGVRREAWRIQLPKVRRGFGARHTLLR